MERLAGGAALDGLLVVRGVRRADMELASE
jgi:hypothetical protein